MIKREGLEQSRAFDLYLSLGQDRNIPEVARRVSKSEGTVKKWSRVFGWASRIVEAEKRISAKAAAKVEESLAEFDANTIRIADTVVELFVEKIRDAFEEDGSVSKSGWKPSATEAKLFIDLKRERMAKAGGEIADQGSGIDADAVDGLGVEKVERIVFERIERIARFRKRRDP